MNFDRKREIGGYFAFACGITLVLVRFALKEFRRNDISIEWVVLLFGLAAIFCAVGAWITPEFWWGRWRYTTPLKEPSHERFVDRAQPSAQADDSGSGGPAL